MEGFKFHNGGKEAAYVIGSYFFEAGAILYKHSPYHAF